MSFDLKAEKVISRIVDKFQPNKVIVFGSYVWGGATEESDLDLFIVKKSEKPSSSLSREVREIVYGNEIATDVVYTPEQLKQREELQDPFVCKILTEGKVVYEQQ